MGSGERGQRGRERERERERERRKRWLFEQHKVRIIT